MSEMHSHPKSMLLLIDLLEQKEQENAELKRRINDIRSIVEGYVDGAPDAGLLSKIAGEVYEQTNY